MKSFDLESSPICMFLAHFAGYVVVPDIGAEIWVKANDPAIWVIKNPNLEIAKFFTTLFETQTPFGAEYYNINHYSLTDVTVVNVLGRRADDMYVVNVNIPNCKLIRKLNENTNANI